MKIERHKNDRRVDTGFRADFVRLSCMPEHPGRVCGPSCNAVCPTCSSTVCHCNCSSKCPDIPVHMTSDANFPLEGNIAPLVYELKRLGVFEPCWSCEGHNGRDGKLWKIPRVWFYCDSVVEVRVLSDVLKELQYKELITSPWQVRLNFSDKDNPATTFSLEPEIGPNSHVTLDELRGDIRIITQFLRSGMIDTAGHLAARAGA